MNLLEAQAAHFPISWYAEGTYPWCSCGFNPRDNTKLTAHWAENGIRWVDDHGHLKVEEIDTEDRWYVIEGDDHEQRIAQAPNLDDAMEQVAEGFAAQYDAEYPIGLLNLLGVYDSEEEAGAAYPEAVD